MSSPARRLRGFPKVSGQVDFAFGTFPSRPRGESLSAVKVRDGEVAIVSPNAIGAVSIRVKSRSDSAPPTASFPWHRQRREDLTIALSSGLCAVCLPKASATFPESGDFVQIKQLGHSRAAVTVGIVAFVGAENFAAGGAEPIGFAVHPCAAFDSNRTAGLTSVEGRNG